MKIILCVLFSLFILADDYNVKTKLHNKNKKETIINFMHNKKWYKDINNNEFEIYMISNIPFLKKNLFEVSINVEHPTSYFYLLINNDNKIEEISGESNYNLSILNKYLLSAFNLNKVIARKIIEILLQLKGYGRPDRIITSKNEIADKILPKKKNEFDKLPIENISFFQKEGYKAIKFYSFGRFDASVYSNEIIIKSDTLIFNTKKLLDRAGVTKVIN